MKRLFAALAAVSFLFVASGCGQSGPLYIPGNPSTIQQPPPQAESTADEEQEDDSESDKQSDKQ